jgi:Na+/proline symporter
MLAHPPITPRRASPMRYPVGATSRDLSLVVFLLIACLGWTAGFLHMSARMERIRIATQGDTSDFVPLIAWAGTLLAGLFMVAFGVLTLIGTVQRFFAMRTAQRERRTLIGGCTMTRPVLIALLACVGCILLGLATGLVYLDMRTLRLELEALPHGSPGNTKAMQLANDTGRVWMAMAIGPLGAGMLAASFVLAVAKVRVVELAWSRRNLAS